MPPKSNSVQGKDSFSRMNFLYQASMFMAGKSDTLSAYYGNLCKSIGKKSVLRMEPDIKRTLCKKCNIALKPGITAELSGTDGKRGVLTIKCYKCKHKKNYPNNPEYSFWLEHPDNKSEVHSLANEKESRKRKKQEKSAGIEGSGDT